MHFLQRISMYWLLTLMSLESVGMYVILPSKEVLSQRLKQEGLEKFNTSTGIACILGGQTMRFDDIVSAIDDALFNYKNECVHSKKKSSIKRKTLELMPDYYSIFFKDNPVALAMLKERNKNT